MIAAAIKFLRDRLNDALQPDAGDAALEELVVYAKADKEDAASFKAGAISLVLIGMEEEKILRPDDRYAFTNTAGVRQVVAPEIRMSLHLLLVARFPDDYGRALHHLSDVICYFQSRRVFNHDNAADLDPKIAQLVLELATPSFAEQNEIWGALRAAYLPNALYRVRMVVFRDELARTPVAVSNVTRAVKSIRP